MNNAFAPFLAGREYYSNHRLALIKACRRKAFYYSYHLGGLQDRVGAGALFGDCFHRALARYYKDWAPNGAAQLERRAASHRIFAKAYKENFPPGSPVDSKHTFERGLSILDAYFDHWANEDALFRPVEPELGGIVTIAPQEGDPFDFEPFLYVWIADGIMERVSTEDWVVLETKTTSWSVDRVLVQLEMSHQPQSYVYGVQQFEPSHPVVGVLANIILVAAQKTEFKRDYFMYKSTQIASWRAQTIQAVQDWRRAVGQAVFAPLSDQLNIFFQRTDECTNYGMCSYYKLCQHGPFYNVDQYERHEEWTALEE